jgi:hypothetical protein
MASLDLSDARKHKSPRLAPGGFFVENQVIPIKSKKIENCILNIFLKKNNKTLNFTIQKTLSNTN